MELSNNKIKLPAQGCLGAPGPGRLPSPEEGGTGRHPATPPMTSVDDPGPAMDHGRGDPKAPVSNYGSFVETLPGIFAKDTYRKFLVLKRKDGSSFRELNAFHVMRDIVRVCGSSPRIVPQADGSLLVEARDEEESKRVESIECLASVDVEVCGHTSLNEPRGVIYCKDFVRYSEEDLLDGLKDQGVVRVERIKKKVDGVLVPTPTVIISFDRLTLPDTIQAAYYRLRVKPYIPKPKRCFHCQRFGHVGKTCRRQQQGLPQVCVQCGEANHGDGVVCPNPPSCFNCRGAHPASSYQCDHYKFECEVLAVRTRERVSFAEAKERVRGLFLRPGVTFASVMARHNARPRDRAARAVISPQAPRGGGAAAVSSGGRGTRPPPKGAPPRVGGAPPSRVPTPGPKAGPSARVGAAVGGCTGPPRASSLPDLRGGAAREVAPTLEVSSRGAVASPAEGAADPSAHPRASEPAAVQLASASPPPQGGGWQVVGESRKRKQHLSASPPSNIQKKPARVVAKSPTVVPSVGGKARAPSIVKLKAGPGSSPTKPAGHS